ncbi:glycosyltransferase [Pedobacter petrophilus]|uniref:Glycosyltransferase n=1 Tax=Pedobacter petrophilus TaxID=1908241 RepID=A0A7K0FVR8_9SPHI|nr:glycosyltransferase family A protein [Pedobacter petrophilus]MRX75625.1 glycosyltransferase [Pedobacter petrophilus]
MAVTTNLGLVSFCIPAYNAERYIRFTLESILNQSYPEFEIIIIDDHSTDQTLNTIRHIEDKRFIIQSAERKGAAAARNQALFLSKGKYIIFFDADDWIPPNFLESQLSMLHSEMEVVVCKWGRFFNNDIINTKINQQQIQKDLNFREWILNYWNNNTSMTCPGRILIPKVLIDQTGTWDESLSLNDDFQFFSRIFSQCSIIRFNDLSTFHYRSGISGLSSQKGQVAYTSFYRSLNSGIDLALNKYYDDILIKRACANLLMSFIYECYPNHSALTAEAEVKIIELGGANCRFPAAGKTKILSNFLGWKMAKKLKSLIYER